MTAAYPRYPGIRRVRHLKTSVSTQTLARKMAEAHADAWTLIIADKQTGGRGRMDRQWSSGKGGLYFSLILRPSIPPRALAALSLKLGRVCAKTLRERTGLSTRVKAPNDILAKCAGMNKKYKKICGILIEASSQKGDIVDWLLIGIGVNVSNHIPASLPNAASIAGLTGRKIRTEALLKDLLKSIQKVLSPL